MGNAGIKAEHVNPFIKAAIDTFHTMANLKAHSGKIVMKDKVATAYDVSGIIGLSGGAKGLVALSFPNASALAIVQAITGEKVVKESRIIDSIGELANIVAGAAKKDLSMFKIKISLPTVITGANHSISGPVDAMGLVVPFEYPGGKFDLTVCFKSLI
ncbi:MAG: chemotaxis protein CheX [Fibrobacteria bacterium]